MNLVPAQPDLFDEPGLPGLSQAADIVTPAEEQSLIASIDASPLSPFRFHQWLGKRLTAMYGWSYDFDNGSFTPAETIPDWLLPLQAKAARFAGLPPDELAQALLIRYDPGAGIGWHRDRPVFEHVLGISLGAPATMRFRRRRRGGFDRTSVFVPRRKVNLSPDGRGAPPMGAQHRCYGGDALVDHLSQPVGEGPSARKSVIDVQRRFTSISRPPGTPHRRAARPGPPPPAECAGFETIGKTSSNYP